DEDYIIAVTPSLSTKEPNNSLSMEDEHPDSILATKSNEFIKSSVENLVLILNQHPYNDESDLIESMSTYDSSLIISSKIDSPLDEFSGELTLLKSISPRIDETDCDPEKDIRLIERLLYDNSSPRPPKEFFSDNFDTEIESFSPSPIPYPC
nr:hypothetical protein [Tanacetum cinerariifolium]